MLFWTQDLLVRQRTQTANAPRGHHAEFGIIALQGIANVERQTMAFADASASLQAAVREMADILYGQIELLGKSVKKLERRIRTEALEVEPAKRLMTTPGVGPITVSPLHSVARGASVHEFKAP